LINNAISANTEVEINLLIYYYYLYNIQDVQEMGSVPHWRHGKSERKQKSLISFCNFYNS